MEICSWCDGTTTRWFLPTSSATLAIVVPRIVLMRPGTCAPGGPEDKVLVLPLLFGCSEAEQVGCAKWVLLLVLPGSRSDELASIRKTSQDSCA